MKLRFTIRDLLWLTVAVSLSVSWVLTLVDNHRLCANARLNSYVDSRPVNRPAVDGPVTF